ncbi:MAG: (2Fe-2S)-binding protein, partial [Oscillospiraceae bacterium]|nr:(2Fe-2S)-binding protein [Oscillospiraceae bacterium]
MINLTINNLSVQAEEGETILVAARRAGIKIPTLCYLREVNEIGACRMCVVEVAGQRNLVASCVFPAAEGMEVQTNTPKLRKSRRTTLELIQSNHRADCLSCKRSMDCELQTLCHEYDVDVYRFR